MTDMSQYEGEAFEPKGVQSEAEAIALAEAFLERGNIARNKFYAKLSKKHGRDLRSGIFIYTLQRVTEYPQGWYLSYWLETTDGATIDPPFSEVSVDRQTGETKIGDFRDS